MVKWKITWPRLTYISFSVLYAVVKQITAGHSAWHHTTSNLQPPARFLIGFPCWNEAGKFTNSNHMITGRFWPSSTCVSCQAANLNYMTPGTLHWLQRWGLVTSFLSLLQCNFEWPLNKWLVNKDYLYSFISFPWQRQIKPLQQTSS